jgi:hypothetical protein
MTYRIPLEGKTFVNLYVKEYVGGGKYHCLCSCRNEVDVFGNNLKSGHTTSCGCLKLSADLSGKIFNQVRAIKRSTSKIRGKTKRPCWECECLRCGNLFEAYADELTSGDRKSCGCILEEKTLPEAIRKEFINGTQLSKIKSIPTKANKSGVVGVNWDKSRNKWQASIRYKGHKYNLGRFDDFDLACKVRSEAETIFFT